MYQLDDEMTKLLLGAKLTSNAEEWFHSVPTHISLTVDELLRRMEGMYGRRENRLTLRKEFESRVWQHGETFAEYCHKKIILANKVQIEENEIVDYVIDGIPNKSVRNQAMMQQFPDKETMMKAMENISLGSEQKASGKQEQKMSGTRNLVKAGPVKKYEGDSKQEPKCFNCNELGHIAVNCQKPKREREACFKCLQMGHRAKGWSKGQAKYEAGKDEAEKTGVNIVNGEIKKEIGDFHREVDYEISNETNDFSLNCKLDALLDTSSLISFVKDKFIPPNLVAPSRK